MRLQNDHFDVIATPENAGIFEFDVEMMNCLCIRALGEVIVYSESFSPGYYLLKALAIQEGIEVIDNIEFNPKRPVHQMMLEKIGECAANAAEKIANRFS